MNRKCKALAALLLTVVASGCENAIASSQKTLTVAIESQDFNHDLGALRVATAEFRLKSKPTTWVVTPTLAWRDAPGLSETAAGGSIGVHHDWNGRIATFTEVFGAEAKSPMAHASLSQELSVKAGGKTAVTAGGRWSRYAGGVDVWFVSGGIRQYFRQGSVAYRLTWTKPNTRGGYLSHLVSFTLDDRKGGGKSQLWLSTGAASMGTAQLPDSFRGKDWAVQAQRTQPLGGRIALILSGGVSSYDRPVSRFTATNIGLGIRMSW